MTVKNICVKDLYQKIEGPSDLILIDCREKSEWDEEHIKDAKWLPLTNKENRVEEIKDFQDKEIVVICRSGARSLIMADFLESKGHKNVSNVEGGMMRWIQEGFPTEK